MELYSISKERYYLQKLSRILNYELSTSLLYLASFFGGLIITIAIIATIAFTPFMLYVFFKLRKKAWLISFLVFVIVPTIAFVILGYMLGYLSVFIFVPLAFYYFYCFMLKNVVNERLKELLYKEKLQLETEEERKNKILWQKQFDNDDSSI